MPRWLRWTGRLLAGLVLLIVLAVVAVYVVSSLAIRRTYNFPGFRGQRRPGHRLAGAGAGTWWRRSPGARTATKATSAGR